MSAGDRQLEVAAMGAYGAFTISSADRLGEMPPWGALPPEAQADWRAVADTVRMLGTLAGVTSTHPDGHEAAALQSAAEAIAARYDAWTTREASEVIFTVLEAAAPHVRTAERERCAELVLSLKPQAQSRSDLLDHVAELIREPPALRRVQGG